jgi:hypothetical protein
MLLIPTLLFFMYVLMICRKFGIPNSLSESFYLLPKKYNIIFIIVLTLIPLSTIIILFSKINDFYTLTFISIAVIGNIIVGIFAQFKDTFQKYFHFGGAIISAASIYLWSITILDDYLFPFFIIASIVLLAALNKLVNKKNFVFWLEMGCYYLFYSIANMLYFNTIPYNF